MTESLPTINASLNFLSFVFLVLGLVAIKGGKKERHIKCMVVALIASTIFLSCYLIYHYKVGSVPYPKHDWTRPLYYTILIPHVILAAAMTPFIALLVFNAIKRRFDRHKKIARFTYPVWLFVSLSGVVVYVMLYLT